MYEKYLRPVLKVGSVRDWKWSVRAVRGGGGEGGKEVGFGFGIWGVCD